MRILYNHGLTSEELYTNTPKHVIDKKKAWFKKYQGQGASLSQLISEVFSYTMILVLHKMIDEKKRFNIPQSVGAYLDFAVTKGEEDFKRAVQGGRFADINFVESDFTGYNIKYYFKTSKQSFAYAVYVGGELKRKFIQKINSGEKFYSVHNFSWNDIKQNVYEIFDHLTPKEIDSIVLLGFKRMNNAMKNGCAISLKYNKLGDLLVHIGVVYLNPKKQIEAYVSRMNRKLRMIELWKETKYNGYYYVAINAEQLADWYEDNKTSRTIVKFKMVNLKRIQEETYVLFKHAFIFKVKIKKYKGWSFWMEKLHTRDIEYIGQAYKHKFTPSYMSWKDLIKEYGKQ